MLITPMFSVAAKKTRQEGATSSSKGWGEEVRNPGLEPLFW